MATPANSTLDDDPHDDFDPAYDKNLDNKHDGAENDERAKAKAAHDFYKGAAGMYAGPLDPPPVESN
jgi:hypothetical protein